MQSVFDAYPIFYKGRSIGAGELNPVTEFASKDFLFSSLRKSFSAARSFENSCRIVFRRGFAEVVMVFFMFEGHAGKGN